MQNNPSQSENLDLPASESSAAPLSVSKKIHPEDIRTGDNVAISEIMYQYPSYPWQSCGVTTLQPTEPVNVTCLSPPDTTPMVVRSVCLPFVLCRTEKSHHRVFDLRQVQLVRLDKAFAKAYRAARKADLDSYRQDTDGKNRKKKRNKKKKKRKSLKAKKKK